MEQPGRRYEVLATLGQGGFGTVYRARVLGEGGFHKVVALKVLNRDLVGRADVAGRLRDEARILGMLRHRAVVQVLDLIELDGRWTVVMEFVEGVDLGQMVADSPIPVRPALEIVQEVAGLLDVAWNAPGPGGAPMHILHRDLKPSNLFVTVAGGVKVLDFGIARAEFEGRESVTRSIGYGSPEYMSPERLEWQNGPESDIYALGCVLFELLVGRRFGISSGHPDRHARKVEEARAELRQVVGPEGAAVDALLGRLLAYEPADRPSARELERLCDGLIAEVRGSRLRDWAETNVHRLRASRLEGPVEGLSSTVLTEGTPVPQATLPDAPTLATHDEGMASRHLRLVVLAGALGAMLMVAGSGLLLWQLFGDRLLGPTPTAAGTVTEPATPPVAAPAVAPATPATPATPTTPTTPATPTTSATPTAEPTPPKPRSSSPRTARVSTPAPTEPAPASTDGTIRVQGDAEVVLLQRGGRSYAAPGAVPAGTYSVLVTFPGREPLAGGSVTVAAGGTATLNCSSQFKRCTAR